MGSATPGVGTNFGQQALSFAQTYINNGVEFGTNACLAFVRSAYGFASDPVAPENGHVSASAAWDQVPGDQRYTDANPPPGVPVYWTGGSSGFGHIAISEGNGMVASTDFGPSGYVGDGRVRSVAISEINKADSALHYQGWSPDLGPVPASQGTYGTVYNTPGTGETTVSGDAPVSTSQSASGILGFFTDAGAFLKGGAERLALFVGGGLLLLLVLWKLGGS